MEILRSKAILVSVIDQLKLAEDPDFNASDAAAGSGCSARVKALFGVQPATPSQSSRPIELDDLVAAFADRLVIARIGFSNVIEIKYNSSDPKRAAEVANALANTYIVDQLNAKFEANRIATTWLHERLKDLGQQALTAERAVNAFRSQHNIVAADGKLMDEQPVTELNSRLVAARAQTSDALTRLNRFRSHSSLERHGGDFGEREPRGVDFGYAEQFDHHQSSSAIPGTCKARNGVVRARRPGPPCGRQLARKDAGPALVHSGRGPQARRGKQERLRSSQAAAGRCREAAGAGRGAIPVGEFSQVDAARTRDERQRLPQPL